MRKGNRERAEIKNLSVCLSLDDEENKSKNDGEQINEEKLTLSQCSAINEMRASAMTIQSDNIRVFSLYFKDE